MHDVQCTNTCSQYNCNSFFSSSDKYFLFFSLYFNFCYCWRSVDQWYMEICIVLCGATIIQLKLITYQFFAELIFNKQKTLIINNCLHEPQISVIRNKFFFSFHFCKPFICTLTHTYDYHSIPFEIRKCWLQLFFRYSVLWLFFFSFSIHFFIHKLRGRQNYQKICSIKHKQGQLHLFPCPSCFVRYGSIRAW